MPIPIQDEPESTIGRKPVKPPEPPASPEHEHEHEHEPGRAGAAIRREEGDESEFAGEIRERERGEPPTVQGIEE